MILLIELSGSEYEKQVVASEKICMITFYKENCKVCTALLPIVEKLSQEYENIIDFYKMNALLPDSKPIFKQLKLNGLPQTVFMKNGTLVDVFPGGLSEMELRSRIERFLQKKQGFFSRIKSMLNKA